ncbi:hypothetical protein BsWGS_03669 [Bradybaena similaris]
MPQYLDNIQAAGAMLGHDPCRVTLHIITDTCQAVSLFDLYQDVINWVDPHLRLFRITERADAPDDTSHTKLQAIGKCCDIPAIAMTIFLKAADENGNDNDKEEVGGSYRADAALQMFRHHPWRFHHSEQIAQGKINVVSSNSQDFYYTSDDLPLWAVRHVHYGREHVRYVLYTSEYSWPDQVHFYELILGIEPDVLREDFCLFTLYTHDDYDVQFALKKLDSSMNIITLNNVHIHVKVKDIGLLVPLFPNVCRPISDVKWQTTDHEGNVIVLDSSQCYSSASNNNNLPCQTSNFDIKSSYTSKESSVGQTQLCFASNRHIDAVSLQSSELSIIPPDPRSFLHTQLDTSSPSFDFEDFGIDLPSPPLRHLTKTEEDDESLCLTSASEESGIHMQHGSEDLSFCEEESLRPCLSKRPALKIRHVKFKVRFKEEVEAFEDSFSRFSSGIESEGQSDTEMETSFRYNPSYTVNSHLSIEEHANNGLSYSTTNDITTHTMSSPVSSFNKEIEDNACTVLAADLCLPQDAHISQCLPKCQLSNTSDICNVDRVRRVQTSDHIDKDTTAASLKVSHAHCNQQTHTRQQYMSSNQCTSTSKRNSYNEIHELPLSKTSPDASLDVCRHCCCSNIQSFTSIHKPLSSNKTRIESTSFRHQTNRKQINFRPSSNITLAKSNHERQHKNRPASVNIPEKRESQLSTPSANDCGKQLISVEPNPLDNKTLPDERTKFNPFPQLQHFQNGQKRFWFDESNKGLAQNGCSDLKDTTLKFTLKFDTCPTSGLSSQQEQIGFYV